MYKNRYEFIINIYYMSRNIFHLIIFIIFIILIIFIIYINFFCFTN